MERAGDHRIGLLRAPGRIRAGLAARHQIASRRSKRKACDQSRQGKTIQHHARSTARRRLILGCRHGKSAPAAVWLQERFPRLVGAAPGPFGGNGPRGIGGEALADPALPLPLFIYILSNLNIEASALQAAVQPAPLP
jgi:hypothetical protein